MQRAGSASSRPFLLERQPCGQGGRAGADAVRRGQGSGPLQAAFASNHLCYRAARFAMSRRLLSLVGFLAVAAAIVVVLSVTTGGDSGNNNKSKDDPQPNNPRFHTKAVADHYGGPVPLTVRFNVKPFNTHGQVQYRFHFDDGTASTTKSPVHTFTKPGYYQVLMDAR